MNKITFNLNGKKVVESILWLASRKKEGVDIYFIIKAMFYSDIYHLNTYGRVISGDTYTAMTYGPVPSKTYDILKMDPLALDYAGYKAFPFRRNGTKIKSLRTPEMKFFSKSDIEALKHGWDQVKDKTFAQIKDNTHEHKAYKIKWDDPNRTMESVIMDFEDMVEDKDVKDELVHTAKFIKL